MRFERVDISFAPLIDSNGHHYEEMEDGYVNFGSVSRNLLDKQCQYGSRYITGKIEGYPSLGSNLRFSGLGEDYHSIGIHPDDIEEFRHRYEAYQALTKGFIKDDESNTLKLSEADKETLRNYLINAGVGQLDNH